MTAVAFDANTLARWRANPIAFIQEVLHDPETGQPFVLSPAERAFLRLAFTLDADGRLAYPELVFGAIKKSGKSTLAALIMLTMVLLLGGRFAEGYCVANDLEQAVGRVFTMARRIVEASPLLRDVARITAERISFPALGATIQAIGADYAGAAGANPTITCFDELWGYTSERLRRLWDEMITSPARQISCRLTVSYAGFSGESELLEELYRRGKALPEVGSNLHAGDGMLFAWHTQPIAPWQDERWLSEMRRSLRPNAYLRMIENVFVTAETSFIDMSWYDQCVSPTATPIATDPDLPVWVGIDASVKHDSSAIAATTWDKTGQVGRLVFHRIYQPTPDDPLDFEATIEATVLDLRKRFRVRKVLYDPYQMVASAQRLAREGVKMEEFPQSVPNLTAASQNLFEMLQGRTLVLYPNADIRLAMSRAIAIETSRGWRIAKEKQNHKIDVVIALAMSALASVRSPGESNYDSQYLGWSDTPSEVLTTGRRDFLGMRFIS
jgi:Terminase large subunit, ATPase domain